MKKTMLIVLLVVLLGAGAACRASEAGSAELWFSSFDGGGPEYSVSIDDPTVVTCTRERVYDNADHEMMTGSGYKVIFTFTGLKPGETGMTISARSPIADNFDAAYTVAVDEALNVTIRCVQAISRFSLFRTGYVAYDSYEIIVLEGEYQVSVNGEPFRPMDPAVADALYDVYERYDIAQWDGFDGEQPEVLDGEGFSLEILLTDGTYVFARGYNAFPEHYFDAVGEMQEILDGIEPPASAAAGMLQDLLAGLFAGKREWVVGTDIGFGDITEFYYTYSASTCPPHYQRYHFYAEDGRIMFYHETREGGGWPQTEEDITVSGTVELSGEQAASFFARIEGGTVRHREESLDDGDAGPWMYLYWNGDQGDIQEYSFPSWGAQTEFEDFCAGLRD